MVFKYATYMLAAMNNSIPTIISKNNYTNYFEFSAPHFINLLLFLEFKPKRFTILA